MLIYRIPGQRSRNKFAFLSFLANNRTAKVVLFILRDKFFYLFLLYISLIGSTFPIVVHITHINSENPI